MLYPIYLYGNPVLREVAKDIPADYEGKEQLVADMFETLHKSGNGIGLAAPQIGLPIRMFVIDLSIIDDDEHPEWKDFKKVFINAHIVETSGEDVTMTEGCLSLPGMEGKVTRKNVVKIAYEDEKGEKHTDTFSDYPARVIQHEYDHLDGHLYIDRMSLLGRQMAKGKISKIEKGKVHVGYKIHK